MSRKFYIRTKDRKFYIRTKDKKFYIRTKDAKCTFTLSIKLVLLNPVKLGSLQISVIVYTIQWEKENRGI